MLPVRAEYASQRPVAGAGLDLRQLWAIVLHRAPLGLAMALAAFLVVMLIVMQTPRIYASSASVLIEPRTPTVMRNQEVVGALPADTSVVDTQVEMLKTRTLAQAVATRLNLYNDPEFNGGANQQRRLFGVIPLPGKAQPATADTNTAVVDNLMRHVWVRRLGLTYVIAVDVKSTSAPKSARIANAWVQEYLAAQMQAKTGMTHSADTWLNSSLARLRSESEAADAMVQQYTNAHGLMSSEGATMAEQEVTKLNDQIAVAQADLAEKQARLNAAQDQLRHGGKGADVGAALGSDTIRELRKQEADASRKVADLSTRYGPRYPDLQKAQSELADSRSQVQLEINRILSSLRADVQVSAQRLASLRNSLGGAQGQLAQNGQAQVGLIGLQQRADAARTIYEAYLNRAKEVTAQDGLQLPDARVASVAPVPTHPVSPNMRVATAAAVVIGLLAGIISMIIAEIWGGALRTRSDVERKLDIPFAGIIPDPATIRAHDRNHIRPAPADYVVEQPFSSYSEAFRSLRAFLMLWGSREAAPKVIALTSALPREGKSTSSLCLARALAMSGSKVLLVDCDARRSGLNALVGQPERGLGELLEGRARPVDVIVPDPRTGAWVLPWGRRANPQDLITQPALDETLERLRGEFDYIVLDTPPVLAVADARVVAARADITLMLVEWNRTPARAAAAAVDLLQSAGANLVGVALNKVDVRLQSQYGAGDSVYDYGPAVARQYFAS